MREHLTYSNVVATIALVVAVAGGSSAVAISASKKAPKNSVTSASIRDGSVTANDLAKINIVSTFGFNTATCGPAEKLTGGGAIAIDGSGTDRTTATERLQRSYPVGNGWTSQGLANSSAYALCLSAKPGK